MNKNQDYKITYNLHETNKEVFVKGVEQLTDKVIELQAMWGVGQMAFQVAGWVPCNNKGEIIWNGRYENLTEEGVI